MSTIKLTNDVQISTDSLNGVVGIDTSRILASGDNFTYTATEDCWAYAGSGARTVMLNGKDISWSESSMRCPIPLKKGDRIWGWYVRIYAVKNK